MANREQGEFSLTLGGNSYRFKMGTAALIEFQELFTTANKVPTIEELVGEVNRGRLKYIHAFLWAGLQKYHAEVTLDGVSDLLDGSNEDEVRQLLVSLGLSTQPDPQDVEVLKPPAGNPRKARARSRGKGGSGGISTSMLAESA